MFTTANHRYQNDHIFYAIQSTPMGRLLVAATQRGVCLTELSESDEPMLNYLKSRFRLAVIAPATADHPVQRWIGQVSDYLSATRENLSVPLDVRGTEFQLAVWQHLIQIPVGTTTSYGAVAKAVGRPKASRAVGAAVGHNPIAIHIACHRVVGQNGSLTGFRWGLPLKKRILAREGALSQDVMI